MRLLKDTFGHRLRIARADVGISQRELGIRVGVSVQAVSQWEADRAEPLKLRVIGEIACVLGVRPSWLAFGDGEMRGVA